MIVRAAVASDGEGIAHVHVESWRSTYKGHVPDDVLAGLSVAQRAETWRGVIAQSGPGRGVLVLEDEGAVVGFCHYCPDRDGADDTGEITSIYLLADRWRRGGGAQLMDAAESAMTDAGYARAVLWVLDANERARAFYAARGWAPDGATKIDDREQFQLHEVRYVRRLAV
jgi:GNAT superfamily N-acetyltransferase